VAARERAHVITAAFSRAVERTAPVLPGALVGPVSEIAGSLAYALSPRARAAVLANLEVVAPGRADHERIARRVFAGQARHYLETFRLLRLAPERLLAMVDVEGWAHFAQAHARGKGVVLASAHLGPVVLSGQVLAARGFDVAVIVEPKAGDIGRVIDRARSAMGIRTVESTSPMSVVRILRRGGVVGVLADRAITGVGERVPFFGREALLPSAHVALAMRTGAALVPGFALREGGRLRAFAEPELELPRTGDREADLREGVRRWAAVLERWIGRAPEQWSVFEPVWSR
jgi:KDO2-lipid IV(A) lauroyltransferase